MGALSCALLVINNIRDRERDSQVGKSTLAVRLGDQNSRRFFIFLLAISYLAAPLTGHVLALLTLATAPQALSLSREVRAGASGSALIPLLARTGQLQLHFAITFALALSF